MVHGTMGPLYTVALILFALQITATEGTTSLEIPLDHSNNTNTSKVHTYPAPCENDECVAYYNLTNIMDDVMQGKRYIKYFINQDVNYYIDVYDPVLHSFSLYVVS